MYDLDLMLANFLVMWIIILFSMLDLDLMFFFSKKMKSLNFFLVKEINVWYAGKFYFLVFS